jgi:hypothetical protein
MDRTNLRQFLDEHFNDEELRNLCFDLKIDYESLPAQGKSGKVRELVTYCERHGRTNQLIGASHSLRPMAAPTAPSAKGPPSDDQGLQAIWTRLAGADDALKAELATLEQRLRDNNRDIKLFGSSENLRTDRSRIIYALNEFALSHCGVSFNELRSGQ